MSDIPQTLCYSKQETFFNATWVKIPISDWPKYGHPNVFTQTTRHNNEQIDPTQQLPLFPLWANMVQGSIEFCRVAWDLEHLQKYPINVFVAGGTPFLLNTAEQQHTRYLEAQFPQAQPRRTYTHDRIQTTIESALDMYLSQNKDTLNRCRIVILAVAKQPTEQSFQFRNNPEDTVRDLRLMACDAIETITRDDRKIDHVDIDVLRLWPFTDKKTPLPKSILSKQITSQLTMSIHTIPNGQDDLKYAMKHLAQLYYNVHVLHISNIPMKSAEQVTITRTVTLFYQANGRHLIDQQKPVIGLELYNPNYLKHRELELTYSKRSKRALPEHEWCTCMHSISPLNLYDLATEVFLEMTLQGSISYLVKHETTSWSHVLMAHHGTIFLHCLDSQLHDQFAEVEKDWTQLSKVKVEGTGRLAIQPTIIKTSELTDTILRPNLFDNVHHYLTSARSNSMCKTVPLNPFRFSHHLLITHKLEGNSLHTSRSIEKSTRWRTCFRNCEGTDRFPVTLENAESIEDLSNDVLNGIPQSSGFGVAVGLVRDLFEQLQDVLAKDVILEKEVKPTKELIPMLVSQLMQGMEGSQKVFIKGLSKAEAKLVSKKLLVALYLIGKRFASDSEQHQELCLYIISTIDALKKQTIQATESSQVKKEENVLEDVWNQVSRYENMSLREREEAAQGIVPDMKRPMNNDPIPFSNQLPPHLLKQPASNSISSSSVAAPKFNPAFRSRRGNNPLDPRQRPPQENQPAYPNPSAAVPYLVYIRPTIEEKAEEEKAEEDSLGDPGNLLWLYWMHDKARKRGSQEEGDSSSGTELVHKDNQWKRVKKEFLGRMALAGEKGETT